MGSQLCIDKKEFDIETVEDEIRVDRLCQELLLGFYQALLDSGIAPEEATALANGADIFVRDFVVAVKQQNLFTEQPGVVRRFGGNWYIVSTYEPKMELLSRHLRGIARFYRHLCDLALISEEFCRQMEEECSDTRFYEQRIKSFFDITGDGYLEWERACSLRERKEATSGG